MSRLRSQSIFESQIKPHHGAEINWSHVLAPRWVYLLAEGIGPTVRPKARVGNRLSATRLVIDPGWTTTAKGIGPIFTGVNQALEFAGNDPFYVTSPPFTLDIIFRPAATSVAYGGVLSLVQVGLNGVHFSDGSGSTSSFRPNLVIIAAGTETQNWYGANTFSFPTLTHFIATYDGTTGKIYADGRDQNAASTAPLGYGITTQIVIGRNTFATQNGTVLRVAAYDRALTVSEILELTSNPYIYVEQTRRRYFSFTQAAAAAQTIFTQEHLGRGIGRGVLIGR